MKRKLQVFISSTYADLIEERQAAVRAILKAGHIPAGMELFTAGDRSQMVTIKEWIDESDVYMLILGGRYGSVEATSGISYTELEYDYALEQGKPGFAVVISDAALDQKAKINGTAFLEMNNQNELTLFRAKVLTNISSFFDDHKDIKLCVHESLADFAAKRELKGWVSADELVDTKPLFEEIRKMSEENRALKDTVLEMEKRMTAVGTAVDRSAETFVELRKVLSAIDITIPAPLADGKEVTLNLFSMLYNNKDILINGVTNAANGSTAEHFFYHNVCPKLQTHGLTINEKVPGVRYRRSCISPLGNKFLAAMERAILLSEKTPIAESSSIQTATKSSMPRTKKTTRK